MADINTGMLPNRMSGNTDWWSQNAPPAASGGSQNYTGTIDTRPLPPGYQPPIDSYGNPMTLMPVYQGGQGGAPGSYQGNQGAKVPPAGMGSSDPTTGSLGMGGGTWGAVNPFMSNSAAAIQSLNALGSNTQNSSGYAMMQAPSGGMRKQVPRDHVQHYLQQGATVIG